MAEQRGARGWLTGVSRAEQPLSAPNTRALRSLRGFDDFLQRIHCHRASFLYANVLARYSSWNITKGHLIRLFATMGTLFELKTTSSPWFVGFCILRSPMGQESGSRTPSDIFLSDRRLGLLSNGWVYVP